MPEFTRPATWEDLKDLARRLRDARVEYALVGGYAIATHGFNRFSEDIDLGGVALKLLNLEGLLLTKQGARPKDQLDAALLRQALAALREPKA